jgi:hypothetical protein
MGELTVDYYCDVGADVIIVKPNRICILHPTRNSHLPGLPMGSLRVCSNHVSSVQKFQGMITSHLRACLIKKIRSKFRSFDVVELINFGFDFCRLWVVFNQKCDCLSIQVLNSQVSLKQVNGECRFRYVYPPSWVPYNKFQLKKWWIPRWEADKDGECPVHLPK